MGLKARKNKRKRELLEEELEHHIATDWADFRRYTPKKEFVLEETVFRFSEGPFWGKPISSVPAWYIDFLCCGGENFLLWKDEALSIALAKMGYGKVEPPKALSLLPIASLPDSTSCIPDYSALANIARNAPDRSYLLTVADVKQAATEGPGLHMQSDIDRSRVYDADMKRKLHGFRNGVNQTLALRN